MLILKNISIKNFMSVGNCTQAVSFNDVDLILVLGENLDLGGNDNRNGVGKSSLLNALSYALYGEALTKIKKDNLINKTNAKNMVVTLEFEKDGNEYRIERSRRPSNLKFIVNGNEVGNEEIDEAQGDNRVTQLEIERIINLSRDMFKNIVALNTYSEPFLAMKSHDQRVLIEQLLGITKLSEKAETLREHLRQTKDAIKEEELKVKATQQANAKIEENIKSLEIKSRTWDKNHHSTITQLSAQLKVLQALNIDAEIASHKFNKERNILQQQHTDKSKDISSAEKELNIYKKNYAALCSQLNITSETSACPTCKQDMDSAIHLNVHTELLNQVSALSNYISEKEKKINLLNADLSNIIVPTLQTTVYNSSDEAYKHRSIVDQLLANINSETSQVNTYNEQIASLKQHGLQEIKFDLINSYSTYRDHQEFLLKLLTSKDSFIRKKIIDQNLLYLNSRMTHFLSKIGLPHEVKFKSDLEVEISQYGKDYDFDNLSRGERTRLILSMSWAFRDVYESLNERINLLFIDELLDSGLDTSGVENAVSVLKQMSREHKRNIFLVSHRDELVGRVESTLQVVKENGFTLFSKGE